MVKSVKCCKCGKEHQLFYRTFKTSEIECSHCHKKMVISDKTKKFSFVVKVLLTFVSAIFMVGVLTLLGVNTFVPTIVCAVGLGLMLAGFLDQFSLFLTNMIKGVKYEPLEEVKTEKKKK